MITELPTNAWVPPNAVILTTELTSMTVVCDTRNGESLRNGVATGPGVLREPKSLSPRILMQLSRYIGSRRCVAPGAAVRR